MSGAKPNYVWSEGVILRMDNRRQLDMSIYRGQGQWERWLEVRDWYLGLPLSDEEAAERIGNFDRGLQRL